MQATSPHQSVALWYDRYGRKNLPWRQTRDPYAIYVSEIMLQQTQVATVLARFYHPFMKKFPTLAALAAANEDDVMKAWEGLGYYRRARHLHAAAKQSGGKLPDTVEGLLALPGIGRNTAHAVAAFAYRRPVPVLEANVRRVVARVFALAQPTEAELWGGAARLLDKDDPFTHNQAMMDLGALVCTPRDPACGVCPLAEACRGRETPHRYPAPKKKARPPVRRKHIYICVEGGRCFMQPRRGEFLSGLYGFIEADAAEASAPGVASAGRVTQQYSHFTLEGEVFIVAARDAEALWRPLHNKGRWVTPEEALALPTSRADQKALRLWLR